MRILVVVAVAALTGSCSCPGPAAEPQAPTSTAPAPAPAPTAPAAGDRTPAIPAEHPQYGRVEGASFPNACSTDADCHVGGCSSEVCSAEAGVNTTCEAPADGWPTTGAGCGCLAGQCVWSRPAGAVAPVTPAPPPELAPPTSAPAPPAPAPPAAAPPAPAPPAPIDPAAKLPEQGKPCSKEGRCAAGLACLTYFGVAGPSGPKFTSCEISCSKGQRCPDSQRCVTIADGPGQVCRP